MATLVLTTVGTMFGGPIGGMIGAMAGQYIDQNILFKPKPVHGPRLTDLAVQTSSYGSQIPRLYGRMRVAGTVIWALPLRERRKRHRAKGQPDQYTYSYSASFAVALSSRRVTGIGRIWADGTLIRSGDGRFTLDTGFRLHPGDPGQPADPLIASAEGIARTPAHRDLAYVVFEDFPLGDFGNRIPALTFELIADADAISGETVLADLLPGLVAQGAGADFALTGYAASGSDRLSAAQPIIDAAGLMLGGDGPRLTRAAAPVALPASAIAAAKGEAYPHIERRADASVPRSIAVRHYDPARDWLVGLERAPVAARQTTGREELTDCPMAMPRDLAAALARRLASRAVAAQQRITLPLGPLGFACPVGRVIELPEQRGRWRIMAWRWRSGGGEVELHRIGSDQPWPNAPLLPPVETPPGTLHVALFDLPRWPGVNGAALGFAQASETGGGAVEIGALLAGSDEVHPLARVPETPVLGFADSALAVGSPALFDDCSMVEVTLVKADMALAHASGAALLAGANLAMLGAEMIQYGRADPWPPAADGRPRYRLSHLLRGRGGTEDAIATHQTGEAFVPLGSVDDPALALLPERIGLQPLGPGTIITARRPGTETPLLIEVATAGRALRPLAPVHVRTERQTDSGFALSWTRRSRDGWDWRDGLDAPLDEPVEAYRVTLTPNIGAPVSADVTEPHMLVDASVVTGWRATGASEFSITIVQIGQQALSQAALSNLAL